MTNFSGLYCMRAEIKAASGNLKPAGFFSIELCCCWCGFPRERKKCESYECWGLFMWASLSSCSFLCAWFIIRKAIHSFWQPYWRNLTLGWRFPRSDFIVLCIVVLLEIDYSVSNARLFWQRLARLLFHFEIITLTTSGFITIVIW